MLTDVKRYQRAYELGIQDAEAGVEHRLEICGDDKEYNFYIKGRKDAKVVVVIPESTKVPEETLQPINLDYETAD